MIGSVVMSSGSGPSASGLTAGATLEWPDNEPAGMTELLNFDGSATEPGTPTFVGAEWENTSRVSVQSDGDSRYGSVVEKKFFVGDGSEWNGLVEYADLTTHRHRYVRWIVKYSANYDVHSSGEKHFYLAHTGGDGADVYIVMKADREIGIANDLTGGGFAEALSGYTMPLDQYVAFELYFVAESTAGASDGSYTLWADGVQILTASSINWTSNTPGWTGVQLYGFWGGAGDTKTANDNVRISEFYLSGKN